MKHVPVRTCIVCREGKSKAELVRVVRGADGTVSVDTSGKADGRGAYVCRNAECMSALVKKHVLDRAYKCKLPQSVYDGLSAEFASMIKDDDKD